MQRRNFFLFALPALLTLTGCDFEDWGDSRRFKEPFSENRPFKSGGRLWLESVNGSVDVIGWDKEAIEITGEKYAATEDLLSQLKVDISVSGDSARIRLLRPSDRRGSCGARFVIHAPKKLTIDRVDTSNGGLRVENVTGSVRFKSSNGGVKVYQVKGDLDLDTSNGGMEILQFEGSAKLHTSNGRIRAEGIRGSFDADTSNGSIDATIEEIDPGRPIRLDTSNGSINLNMKAFRNNDILADTSNSSINVTLPASAAFRLKADTSNGSISNDFEMSNVTNRGKTVLEGSVGSGGALLTLDTSNGNIRLMKR